MEHNSENLSIFVPWFSKKPRHRGELLSFDPSENLQNSKYAGEKSESCSSCSSIYTACSAMESAHVYTCRCELFFSFLRIRVLQNLQTENVRRLTLFVPYKHLNRDVIQKRENAENPKNRVGFKFK